MAFFHFSSLDNRIGYIDKEKKRNKKMFLDEHVHVNENTISLI